MGLDVSSHLHPVGSFDLADHPVPNGREEVWRFTPLKRLRGLHDEAVLTGTDFDVKVEAPEGVRAESVPTAESERGAERLRAAPTASSARVWQSARRACSPSRCPPTTEVADPIVVDVHRHTAPATRWPASCSSRSAPTPRPPWCCSSTARRPSPTTSRSCSPTALGSPTSPSRTGPTTPCTTRTQHALVGRDASLKHVAVTFGGSVVRHDVTATYDGPGGDIEMLGLYFADAGQHIEHRLFVDHNAPKTRSHVTYKGALQGQGAHTVWIGNVLIRKEAEGIETYEENRNLVLTDGCQADSVPNLEIETGEIAGAGHASATGRFDDEQLFYLRSRGIEEKEARRLVVHGFFNDLIRRIDGARPSRSSSPPRWRPSCPRTS